MEEEKTNSELYVTDLEEALKSAKGQEHVDLLNKKLEKLSSWAQEQSKQPQTESNFQRIQTVMSGITAAKDVLHKFPVTH
ncbi:EscE/YscE/SsaE family type III secretion system needle protein co-chaperone [Pseudovibrio sp. Tun.PSC04-5.I4]|uniref:EscE/YscE/SsaE family type III secretion system needle protein co-chaperone n=1 Tax=Pseudovibrio sp. Tun.PSC04-5.I4 TaxID=1798213 RepID=UPI000887E938|nr:EscE/YscE/SsaE family type III secretion system needle protein co-chaperone [Pseudovibrio sp. Tun.PSC04-5.I4]SDR15221.1 Type III secretion system, E component of needle [Pseudovibrio sp. Tun.PSC04-5.I4]